jgi:hypothetical protein
VDTQQKEATITYDNVIDMSGKVPTRGRAFEQDAVEQRTMAYQLQGEDVKRHQRQRVESDACMSNGWSDREHGAPEMHLARGAARHEVHLKMKWQYWGGGVLGVWRRAREELSGSNVTDRVGWGSVSWCGVSSEWRSTTSRVRR